jgi:hypothetical protein
MFKNTMRTEARVNALARAVSFVMLVMLVTDPLAGGAGANVAPRIRVKGMARIDAHAARSSGKLVLAGLVTDEAARPAAGMRVVITLSRGRDIEHAAPAAALDIAGAAPQACTDNGTPPLLDRGDRLLAVADDRGRFCVRLDVPTDRYVAHFEPGASNLLESERFDLSVDLTLTQVMLRFDPERSTLPMDGSATVIDALASTEEDGATGPLAGLPLALSNESGVNLGEEATDAAGRARFVVPSSHLGPPGNGELRVSFRGNADAAASSHVARIERSTRVQLAVSDRAGGRSPSRWADDSLALRVVAETACSQSGCAASPTGTVEALAGDRGSDSVVGAGTLEGGVAQVVCALGPARDAAAPLRLRYVPDAPWFLPAGDLVLVLPPRPQNPWGRLAILLAGLAMLMWLATARFPSLARLSFGRPPGRRPLEADKGAAHVKLVRQNGSASWTGEVVDAHDGTVIAGARVAIERRGFTRVEIAVEATADASGAFVLTANEDRDGDELVAGGPLHVTLRRPPPARGEIRIALVQRKRALLDRLVAWARARGQPFDASPDPTPAHIRKAARSQPVVARWADAVERAAYGGAVVDARAQAEVDQLSPEAVDTDGLRPKSPPKSPPS